MKVERVTLAMIKADIENAFGNWKDLPPSQYVSGVKEWGQEAENRVAAFLCGVEANESRLKVAMAICRSSRQG